MSYNSTERVGINRVGYIVSLELGWIFREQPTDDWGIDAQIEIVLNGIPTGRLVAAQIKTGISWFSEKNDDGYTFRGERRHLEYWRNHSLPVILILCNPESGTVLWAAITKTNVKETKKGWKITVPFNAKLDHKAATPLRDISLPENIKRDRFGHIASLINGFAANSPGSPTGKPTIYAALFSAQNRISVCSPYQLSDELIYALVVASTSVLVQIITGADHIDIARPVRIPSSPSFQIRVFDNNKVRLHDRSILLDGGLLIIHSGNILTNIIDIHHESFFATIDHERINGHKTSFDKIWDLCVPLSTPDG